MESSDVEKTLAMIQEIVVNGDNFSSDGELRADIVQESEEFLHVCEKVTAEEWLKIRRRISNLATINEHSERWLQVFLLVAGNSHIGSENKTAAEDDAEEEETTAEDESEEDKTAGPLKKAFAVFWHLCDGGIVWDGIKQRSPATKKAADHAQFVHSKWTRFKNGARRISQRAQDPLAEGVRYLDKHKKTPGLGWLIRLVAFILLLLTIPMLIVYYMYLAAKDPIRKLGNWFAEAIDIDWKPVE